MVTKYPYKIDDNISLPDVIDNITAVNANSVNILKNAILAIENELGVKPSGVQGTVKERFIYLETIVNQAIEQGTFTPGGDLSGTYNSQKVIGIQNIPVSTNSPTIGQTLVFDGTFYTPSFVSGGGGGGGDFIAGGDLAGTSTVQSVIKVRGTSFPAGGTLTPGNIPIVTGAADISYGALNLANSNSVSGILSSANLPSATTGSAGVIRLTQDLGGSSNSPSVVALQGTPVSNTSPTANQVLQLIGGIWTPATLSTYTPTDASTSVKGIVQLAGDLGGTASSPSVLKINTTSVSAGSTTGQVLRATGTNTAAFGAIDLSNSATVTGNLSGTNMSGATDTTQGAVQLTNDLGGTNTSPIVTGIQGIAIAEDDPAVDQVLAYNGSEWIPTTLASATPADASDTNKGIVQLTRDFGGTAALPYVTGLQGRDVAATSPTLNQVLQWNGSVWAPGTVSAGGSTPDATSTIKGIIQLAGDLSGAADAPVVAKVNGTSIASGSTEGKILISDATNSALFKKLDLANINSIEGILPSENMTNASTTVIGTIKLARDLAGSAELPNVVGLQGRNVANTLPTNGQVLTWNNTGTNWEPANIPTYTPTDASTSVKGIVQLTNDFAGTATSPVVAGIRGVAISTTSPTNNQVLQYNGTQWAPTTLTPYSPTDASTSVKGIIQLAGDLGGTAASPAVLKINGTAVTAGGTLTTGTVLRATDTSSSAWGALDLSNSNAITGLLPSGNQDSQNVGGDLSGTTSSATVTKLQTISVSSTTPTNNQVLTYNGSTWIPATPASAAPTAAQYLTLAADATLTNERVLTAGTNISFVDGGAGNALTINNTYTYTPTDATTSAKGIVQLSNDLAGTATSPIVAGIRGVQVSATTPLNNQILQYNGTAWTPATYTPADATLSAKGVVQLAGDLGGSATSPSVLKLRGAAVGLGTSLTTGTILRATGTATADWGPISLSNASAVTGVLAGTNMAGATTSVNGGITLAGDLGGTSTAPLVTKFGGVTVPASAPVAGAALRAVSASVMGWGAIDLANTNAVTGVLAAANLPDANALGKGIIRLQGDLDAGSADSPIVRGIRGVIMGPGPSPDAGEVLVASSASAMVWGQVDLANANAVTGLLPAANLANSGVGAATYNNANITVDNKGRVTAASASVNRRIKGRNAVSGTVNVTSTTIVNLCLSAQISVANGETLVTMGRITHANTTGTPTATQYFDSQVAIYDVASGSFVDTQFGYVTPVARNFTAMAVWTNTSGATRNMQVCCQCGKNQSGFASSNVSGINHWWIETVEA